MARDPSYACPLCRAPMRPTFTPGRAWLCNERHVFSTPHATPDDPSVLIACDAMGVGRLFHPICTTSPTPPRPFPRRLA